MKILRYFLRHIHTEFKENNNNLHLHGTLHITFCIKWLNFEVSDRQSYVTSRRSLLKVGGAWAEHLIGNTWYIKVQVKLCWKVGPGRGGDGGRGGNSSCGHYLHSLEKGNICLNPNRILIPGSKRQTSQWR